MKYLVFLTLFTSLHARFDYLNRSNKALLMGDAFTALADDEMTLFYNPAALGRHRGVSLSFIKPNLQVPDVLDKEIGLDGVGVGLDSQYEDFPDEAEDIADLIMGTPLYFQVGASPTIKMQHLGLTLFAVSKTSFALENAIHPVLDINYRLDRGLVLGYAHHLGKSPGKKPNGSFHTIGAGVKTMNRQGLETSVDLFGTDILEVINDSDSYKEIRSGLGYSKGSALGFDLGYEYNHFKGPTRLGFGASLLDIGGTGFSLEEGSTKLPDQDMSLNLGLAFEQKFALFNYALAMDYHNLIDPNSEAMSKLHIGARVNFPFIGLFTGWNGGYMSGGLNIRAYLFELLLGFYGVETGSAFKQRQGKRIVVSLSLIEFAFNDF